MDVVCSLLFIPSHVTVLKYPLLHNFLNGQGSEEADMSFFSFISARSIIFPFFFLSHHCFISKWYHAFSLNLVLPQAVSLWGSTCNPASFQVPVVSAVNYQDQPVLSILALSVRVSFWGDSVLHLIFCISQLFLRFSHSLYPQAYNSGNFTGICLIFLLTVDSKVTKLSIS